MNTMQQKTCVLAVLSVLFICIVKSGNANVSADAVNGWNTRNFTFPVSKLLSPYTLILPYSINNDLAWFLFSESYTTIQLWNITEAASYNKAKPIFSYSFTPPDSKLTLTCADPKMFFLSEENDEILLLCNSGGSSFKLLPWFLATFSAQNPSDPTKNRFFAKNYDTNGTAESFCVASCVGATITDNQQLFFGINYGMSNWTFYQVDLTAPGLTPSNIGDLPESAYLAEISPDGQYVLVESIFDTPYLVRVYSLPNFQMIVKYRSLVIPEVSFFLWPSSSTAPYGLVVYSSGEFDFNATTVNWPTKKQAAATLYTTPSPDKLFIDMFTQLRWVNDSIYMVSKNYDRTHFTLCALQVSSAASNIALVPIMAYSGVQLTQYGVSSDGRVIVTLINDVVTQFVQA